MRSPILGEEVRVKYMNEDTAVSQLVLGYPESSPLGEVFGPNTAHHNGAEHRGSSGYSL